VAGRGVGSVLAFDVAFDLDPFFP
jgi:hypothetical protein